MTVTIAMRKLAMVKDSGVARSFAERQFSGIQGALKQKTKSLATVVQRPMVARVPPRPPRVPGVRGAFGAKVAVDLYTAKAASIASLTAPGGGGAGPIPCLEGFGAKIESRIQKGVEAMKARLKPGDIINTDPRKPRGPDRAFKALSKAFQGTRFGHSALYDGKGHVIEARGHTVIRRPLSDLARCNRIMAVRPKGVSMADRQRAVKWMSKHVGNDALRVTLGNLVMHGVRPTVVSKAQGGHERRQQKLDRALCSSLIANAYARVPFNEARRIADTRPVDLLHSPHVRVVGKIH